MNTDRLESYGKRKVTVRVWVVLAVVIVVGVLATLARC